METDTFGFGVALQLLREGKKLYRSLWNGKGMWVALQVPTELSKMTLEYFYMKNAQDELHPWTITNSDVLATDWHIFVEDGRENSL